MIKKILNRRILTDWFLVALSVFGFMALFLGVFDVLFPDKFNYGEKGLYTMIVISAVCGIIKAYPRNNFSRHFLEPDTKVIIKTGDLFNEKSHLVIPMNDVFDTEIGEIIHKDSIQGQFLSHCYNGDSNKLQSDIKSALEQNSKTIDAEKKIGNNKRYSIGTVAILDSGESKYFCLAQSYMKTTLEADSDIERLNFSLEKLWSKVREKSSQKKVSIPIIGSGLSRINISYNFLIKMIIFSFITASKNKIITKELTIVIHNKDIQKINFAEIKSFLENI